MDPQRLQLAPPLPSLPAFTISTCRYSRLSTSTNVTRLPWLSASSPCEYQLVTISRRPSKSSLSEASAEVLMPCGHHRSDSLSCRFQVKPQVGPRPGTFACVA